VNSRNLHESHHQFPLFTVHLYLL